MTLQDESEGSLDALFNDLEAQISSHRSQKQLMHAEHLIDKALHLLSVGDTYGATRHYEDILDIYQELSPQSKRLLYPRCSKIHLALLSHQQENQLPAVEELLREYLALHKIGDWANCEKVHLDLLNRAAFLPLEHKQRIQGQLLAHSLPSQIHYVEGYH